MVCKGAGGDFIYEFKQLEVDLHFLNLINGYDLGISKYLKAYSLFREYDILHFHTFNPFLAVLAVRSKRKMIYTEHGVFGFGRKKKLSDYFPFYKNVLVYFLNNKVHYISFNSEFTRRIAQYRYGLKSVRSSVIYNGIDFSDLATGIEMPTVMKNRIKGNFIVGTTSRFAGFKKIERLIEGFSIFQEGRDCLLFLVGDGVSRRDLERKVTECGISEKTVFTGYQSNVRSYQAAMDVCVFPSQNEPFGLVAVETLSLGKPTIVFNDGGGIVEVVGKFDGDDVVDGIDSLVGRLKHYYDRRNGTDPLRKDRVEYAKRFDIKILESNFSDIYREILA